MVYDVQTSDLFFSSQGTQYYLAGVQDIVPALHTGWEKKFKESDKSIGWDLSGLRIMNILNKREPEYFRYI